MTRLITVRDTADRVRPLMYLQRHLVVESVVSDPTRARPGRLRFTTFYIGAGMDADPVIVFHDAGEVVDMRVRVAA
ncbi:hypothetical protein VA596_50030 [Amycolatopsis sp., V23-08]|uniref:Uncharacterized protein n=1 Tax=Amycolatopsis heterodermiae TaxID=3110235 RepID=A0ABU5RN50_9PSEU|nr:hypothetical protein [Amycolatopsis sp., V23-08]MEA5367751.1 hypothetical protein [Amycolatopsis sp., V23-08]